MVFYMFFMLHHKSTQRESFQNSVTLCQACYINNLFFVKFLVQDHLSLGVKNQRLKVKLVHGKHEYFQNDKRNT